MKLDLVAAGCIPPEVAARNDAHARSLGFPIVGSAGAHSRPLALVGGGPSITEHVESLRAWPGDVWAINGAWRWCLERQITARFISIDPLPLVAPLANGAVDAILATVCDPSVFEVVRGATLLDIQPFGVIGCGPTTATAVPSVAARLGYADVTFFGCESSFVDRVRAYDDDRTEYGMRVSCGGQEYTTDAALLMQALALSEIIRTMPGVFRERSGGLLSALIQHVDYDVVAVSPHIHKSLTQAA